MIKMIKNIVTIIFIIIIAYICLPFLKNPNERINKNEIISVAKNKNYSQSIYYPYFELLTNNQKILYQEILDNTKQYNKAFYSSIAFNQNDLKNAFEAVFYDHPELFWLDLSYSAKIINYNSNLQYKVELQFTKTIYYINSAKTEFNKEINKIVTEAQKYKTDYEKELYVHDTLITLLEYDESTIENQNAYDAIISKKAVCSGYAKLFQIIMMKLGIPTYYITGFSNGNHAWNIIELEDGFYNVDVTWDDQQEKIIYKYFNIDDKTIEKDHTRKDMSSKIIRKNGNKYINKLSPLY